MEGRIPNNGMRFIECVFHLDFTFFDFGKAFERDRDYQVLNVNESDRQTDRQTNKETSRET